MRREVPSGQLSRTGGAEQHFRSHSQPACRAEPWEHDRGELADGIGYKGLRELLWGSGVGSGCRTADPQTHHSRQIGCGRCLRYYEQDVKADRVTSAYLQRRFS